MSGSSDLHGDGHCTTNHHRMASCDDHPACRTCMRRTLTWTSETWQKVHRADLRLTKHRLSRAEPKLNGEASGHGTRFSLWGLAPRFKAGPQSEAWRPCIEDGPRLPAEYDPWSVVRPLTVVNSQWKARELERMATMRSRNPLGQVSTLPMANGKHCVPLTVHIGSTGEAQSVHRAVCAWSARCRWPL